MNVMNNKKLIALKTCVLLSLLGSFADLNAQETSVTLADFGLSTSTESSFISDTKKALKATFIVSEYGEAENLP